MLLVALALLQTQPVLATKWQVIDQSELRWVPGQGAYGVAIDQPTRGPGSTHEWQRIRIRTPDGRVFETRSGPGPLVRVREASLDSSLFLDNEAKSPFLYLSPKLRNPSGTPMLILFGWAYASNPGSLMVFSLDRTGFPIEAFSTNEFDLTSIKDLDGDGIPELIGRPTLSQCGGCDRCSYDPYAVYRFLDAGAGKATYSVGLSQKYNEAHYVWAGPTASEQIVVNHCDLKRPRLVAHR